MKQCGENCKYWDYSDGGEFCSGSWGCSNTKAIHAWNRYLYRIDAESINGVLPLLKNSKNTCPFFKKRKKPHPLLSNIEKQKRKKESKKWQNYYKTHSWWQ